MRSLKPLCLTAAVALALAGTSALAATTAARTSAAGTTASTTTGTAASSSSTGTTSTSGTTAAVGGCSGTNGSTCTATSSSDAANSTATGSTVTQQNMPPAIAAGQSTSGTTATTGTAGSGNGDTVPPVRSGQGVNSVNVDPTFSRPGAFDPGGTFGPQAVTGTTTNGVVEGGGVILPNTGTTGGSQQNVFVQPSAQGGVTLMNTPTFDQAARNGQAREARRRAAGNEPRVVGIAPRTERDLTWQMPDDPIIRY